MTKLCLCLDCGDIISPYHTEPKQCHCKRHTAWWDNGIFTVYDKQRHTCPESIRPLCKYKESCRIIGIHNDIFTITDKGEGLYRDRIKKMLEETPEYYLFKSWESMIVVIPIGLTGDIKWSDSPPNLVST